MLRAGLITQQATLAGAIIDLQRLQVNDPRQGAGLHTSTAACAALLVDLGACSHQTSAVQRRTEMLPTPRDKAIRIVKRVHEPEDKAIRCLLSGKLELFDQAHLLTYRLPQGGTQLFQRQPQIGNVAWLHTNQLAADQIDRQTIASGYQHLQVGFLAVERPFTMLAHTAIDNR